MSTIFPIDSTRDSCTIYVIRPSSACVPVPACRVLFSDSERRQRSRLIGKLKIAWAKTKSRGQQQLEDALRSGSQATDYRRTTRSLKNYTLPRCDEQLRQNQHHQPPGGGRSFARWKSPSLVCIKPAKKSRFGLQLAPSNGRYAPPTASGQSTSDAAIKHFKLVPPSKIAKNALFSSVFRAELKDPKIE